MKKSKKDFLIPLLLTIIVLLVAEGGAYAYLNKKNLDKPIPVKIDNTKVSTSTFRGFISGNTSNWKLKEVNSVSTSDYTGREYNLLFSNKSHCYIGNSEEGEFVCFEGKTKWGYGDRVRISGDVLGW